ncbi:MAG: leucine-rich repeat domain-containing protein, partial [Anaerovoracaceae bacterium]
MNFNEKENSTKIFDNYASHSYHNCDDANYGICRKSQWGGCGPSGDETLKWSLNESKDTLTITGDGTTMDNYTDGALTPWNTERASIKSVDIQASALKNIGDYAFKYCTNLATVTLPDSVETIGVGAFEENTSLANIPLLKVKDIGMAAFYGCTALTTAVVKNSVTIGEQAFNKDNNGLITGLKLYVLTAHGDAMELKGTGATGLNLIEAGQVGTTCIYRVTTEG